MKFRSTIPAVIFVFIALFTLNGRAAVTSDQTNRLATVSKVWGLLKYYHPEVGKGKIPWDEILISTIDAVKNEPDQNVFNDAVNRMIQQAGNANFINYLNIFPVLNPDDPVFQWMDRSPLLNWYNRYKLKMIVANHTPFPGVNFYVNYVYSMGNTSFYDDSKFYVGEFPGEQYRLLALFRYWNIIYYFFPYKDVIGEDWEAVQDEFIPKIIDASNALEYHLVIREYTARINDGHSIMGSNVLAEYFGNYYVPFSTRYIESNTIITEVLPRLLENEDHIRVGDIVLAIDGKPVNELRENLRKYTAGSNDAGRERVLDTYLFRGNTPQVALTLLRNNREETVTIQRFFYSEVTEEREILKNREKWNIMEGNIGYVDMGLLQQDDVPAVMNGLMGTGAIIFDIRNFPNNTMYLIAEYLNPEQRDFVSLKYPDLEYPGHFRHNTELPAGPESPNPGYYKGKVVILIDERTISHAEFTCMSFQTAPDATIIGSNSAGADGNTSRVWLPGQIVVKFSGLGVYYPDGGDTQRIGIVPDIKVLPTVAGIIAGRDEVLEKAIEFIKTN